MLKAALALAAAAVLFAIMLIGIVDVIGRFVFSAPLRGASELVEVLMAALVFTALPALSADREHVTIGLIDPYLKGAAQRVQRVAVAAISAASLALFAYCALRHGLKIAPLGDRTDFLAIPKAPVFYLIALGCAAAAIWVPVELLHSRQRRALADASEVGSL